MAGQSAGVTGLGTVSSPITDLGLGSSLVAQQKAETEEERRKRLLGVQSMSSLMPGVTSLYGAGGANGGGY